MKVKHFVRETVVTCDQCGRSESLVHRYADASDALRDVRDAAAGRSDLAVWAHPRGGCGVGRLLSAGNRGARPRRISPRAAS